MNPGVSNKIVIFIYTSLPGYMFRCIELLAKVSNYRIILVETDINKNYPVKFSSEYFDILDFAAFKEFIANISSRDIKKVFITGWANNKIKEMANYFYKEKVRSILLSDQPRKYNIKQRIGKIFLQSYLNKFEYIVVPGKAGYALMLYYGVKQEKIKTGLYTATNEIFNKAKILRESFDNYPKVFLFDGQFIKRKGVNFLIKEYLNYLNLSESPWEMVMIGKGELESKIPIQIRKLGFIHPDNLTEIYANAGCFVLPSYEDHWGVVVHQAACAGLPLLISPYCQSHYEFLNEGLNGYFIDPNKAGSLTEAMLKIEKIELNTLRNFGNKSYELSKAFSVEKWVETFKVFIEE